MQTSRGSLIRVGAQPGASRSIYTLAMAQLTDFPARLDIPCPRFILLLVADFTASRGELPALAKRVVDAGCAYFCAWGPGCEYMHDLVDDTVLALDAEARSDDVLMTTWHSSEPLDDAVHFALFAATPDGAYATGCDAVVLASASDQRWHGEIGNAAAQYLKKHVI